MSIRAVVMSTTWMAAAPQIDDRLRREPPAAVADVACGEGWSAIDLARIYPNVAVMGWDRDDAYIAAARRNASDADLGVRVAFAVLPSSVDPPDVRAFDLVTSSTPLDRVADSEALLRLARELVAPSGAVVMVDPGSRSELVNRARRAGFSEVAALPVTDALFGVYLLGV